MKPMAPLGFPGKNRHLVTIATGVRDVWREIRHLRGQRHQRLPKSLRGVYVASSVVAETRLDVLRALRSLEGRATVGDVVSSAGLPRNEVEAALRGLLETHEGHLDVSDSGELVYVFGRKLMRRDRVSTLRRLKRATAKFLRAAFKAWIVAMLVVYFVVFVALVIAAIVAMMSRGGDRRSGGSWGRVGGRHPGHFHIPSFWIWYYIWTPRWRLGRPYYGHRWERTLEKDDRPPFYKKVFAFVFGPDRPRPTQKQLDRSTIRLIRARRGVLTTAELMEHNALPRPRAEEEMGRLLGSYGGEPTVSRSGELVYTFPELMVSAHGRVTAREPNPAWMRLEHPLDLTGNEKKHDVVIAGMNGFNLLAGATAPWFIFPQLGIGGPTAFVGLVLIPVIFSSLFFCIPLLRTVGGRRENERRRARNVRRVVLGTVYRAALTGRGSLTVEAAFGSVRRRLRDQPPEQGAVEAALHSLAAEFDADVSAGADGALMFAFPAIRRDFVASETIRRKFRLEDRGLGDIVYSSADTSEGSSERELAAFDRELAEAEMDMSGYLPSTDRVGFEDEYEIVAFDEELRRQRIRVR